MKEEDLKQFLIDAIKENQLISFKINNGIIRLGEQGFDTLFINTTKTIIIEVKERGVGITEK
jgi:hypothetical protein